MVDTLYTGFAFAYTRVKDGVCVWGGGEGGGGVTCLLASCSVYLDCHTAIHPQLVCGLLSLRSLN